MVGLLGSLSSLPGAELGLFQQLNQELGALCQEPLSQGLLCDLQYRCAMAQAEQRFKGIDLQSEGHVRLCEAPASRSAHPHSEVVERRSICW